MRAIGILGLITLLGLALLLSENRRKLNYQLILSGVGLQFALGMLLLWTEAGRSFFMAVGQGIRKLVSFSEAGSQMVFGDAFRDHFFAFSVLPTIIFVSAIMSLLFYLGIMQKVVAAFAWIMVRVMQASGSESLAAAANVFVGQTEAPLVIKPYVLTMTRSEILCLMVGGMATVAGGVMAAYASLGVDPGHLLTGSLMAAPGAILMSKIICPETEESLTKGVVKIDIPKSGENILDAICAGAGDGLKLALNVAAMLIAFVALGALINYGFSFLPQVDGQVLSVERILGWIFSPIAYLIGVPIEDARAVGACLGKKMFLNEFVAYLDLHDLKGKISDRSFVITTYALCGFANFSSIAIQIGGIGALVPERRADLARYGLKAMLAGTLTTLMTAAIAGLLI